jgi:integrase
MCYPLERWGNELSARLTDLAVRTEAAGAARREIPDGRIAGLYLVIQPSGAKSWALRYRAAGKPRKFTIGAYPGVGLAAARELAQGALGDIAKGGDPAARKRADRVTARAARDEIDDLVETVVADFVALYAKKKTRDWKETERLLKKDVVSSWRGRRLSEIEKKHVVKLLDTIVERGAPVGANRTFAQLRKMCGWAISRGIITQSPCEGVEAPSPEFERDRVLSERELSLVWRAAAALPAPYGPIIRLLMLTGARRNEVAGMRWTELDSDRENWTLPKERSKNRREHIVPLSSPAAGILASTPVFEHSPFVFGGGRAAPSTFAKTKTRLDAEITRLSDGKPIPHWTIHDLRRSVATQLAEMKIAPHVIEAVLNHKGGTIRGIAAVYNRYSYSAEKRAALDAWARRLDAIVTGAAASNVVELARRDERRRPNPAG